MDGYINTMVTSVNNCPLSFYLDFETSQYFTPDFGFFHICIFMATSFYKDNDKIINSKDTKKRYEIIGWQISIVLIIYLIYVFL